LRFEILVSDRWTSSTANWPRTVGTAKMGDSEAVPNQPITMDLTSRTALVTGSARRLGRAIASGLAQAGADVAVHFHSGTEAASQAAAELRDFGVRSAAFQADLTDPNQISRLFAQLEDSFGRLDILVNSAAIFERTPLLEISVDEWDRVMNLNLRAAFLCTQHAARLMMKSGGGKIVNIADVGAFQAWPAYAHHCVSKAGLVMMTRVTARALAPEILVNAIAPGPVLPPEHLTAEELQQLAEMTPLRRLGAAEDVVSAVLYLVGADYVTGETIVVDGGKLLKT
jgi:pteridine reductase